jgi:glycerol kinase
MSHVLAIDQSTSATKAVLFDAAGNVVDKSAKEHQQHYPQPGWVEHDAEEIWQNTLTVLRELSERNRDAVATATALAITNQRETILAFDRATGKPLCRAMVWQCRRGDEICNQLRAAGHEETIRNKTGLKLDTYFSGSKLKWIGRERPDIAAALKGGAALIGTIDSYLVYRLTGGKVFATDPTNASRTLLYDITRRTWDESLCQLFDVPPKALPEVRESSSAFGETTAEGALAKSLSIRGVMGDSQASLFAQRCYQPGQAKATFGTGTSVMLNVGHELRLGKAGGVAALAWVQSGQPTYALEGLINYSSATIAWLKDQLGLITSAAETESLAAAVSDNGGVYLVPAFSGLSAPYWSNTARAAIVGLTAFSKKEHIVRAALESIAYQIRDCLTMLGEDAGVTPSQLHADGGPTRNTFLMQFVADMTQLKIVVSDVPESSALGACLSAQLGLGEVNSLEQLAAQPRSLTEYAPRMAPAAAEALYSGWKAAVQRVL